MHLGNLFEWFLLAWYWWMHAAAAEEDEKLDYIWSAGSHTRNRQTWTDSNVFEYVTEERTR